MAVIPAIINDVRITPIFGLFSLLKYDHRKDLGWYSQQLLFNQSFSLKCRDNGLT